MDYFLTITREGNVEPLAEARVDAETVIKVLGLALNKTEAVKEEQEMEAPIRKLGKWGKQGERKCKNCGKPGHRRDNCPESPSFRPVIKSRSEESGALTEDQFDQVKFEQSAGSMVSKQFAEDHGVALREVNKAIFSTDYDDYMERRSQ